MRHSSLFERIQKAKNFLEVRLSRKPDFAVVFGSGLAGAFLNQVKIVAQWSFGEIPFFQRTTVLGHGGMLYEADFKGLPLLICDGRLHYYEGHTMSEVAFPVRVYGALGVGELMLTNASGALNPRFKVGDLMVVADHINLTGRNPLRGPNDERLGDRFVDMTEAYDRKIFKKIWRASMKLKMRLQKGIYVGILGPSYETPAEIAMYRKLGGDAVGMSTVPEVIAARHMGLKTGAISCITNLLKSSSKQTVSHEQVVDQAKKVQEKLARLLKEYLCDRS